MAAELKESEFRGLTDKITHRIFQTPESRTGAEAPVLTHQKTHRSIAGFAMKMPTDNHQHHQTKQQLRPF